VNCIGVVFARCFKVLGALGIVFIKVDIMGVRTKTDESLGGARPEVDCLTPLSDITTMKGWLG
jgi:hypothetical protein